MRPDPNAKAVAWVKRSGAGGFLAAHLARLELNDRTGGRELHATDRARAS
jgi:hypothetical protein